MAPGSVDSLTMASIGVASTRSAAEPERPLAQNAEGVQRLFELSVDMLGMASTDGHFTHLNPAWERTLGWSVEELIAEPFLSFVHPDDVDATLAIAARIPEPGEPRASRSRTAIGRAPATTG